MGALPPRYSFVLNPHHRERFTKCPSCDASTRIRKLPLIVDRAELENVIIAAGLSATGKPPDYVVLGTIDRRTWRRGLDDDASLQDIRQHMADFKKYLRVDVVPAIFAW